MKLSKQLRIFFTFYLMVFGVLAAIFYFDAFSEPRQTIGLLLISTIFPSLTEEIMIIPWHIELAIAFVLSIFPSFYFLVIKKRATTLTVTTTCFVLLASVALLHFEKILLPILYLEIAIATGAFAAVILRMIFASSEAEFLRLAFSQFVSEKMLKELLWNPDKLKLQGKEAKLTVMFMDIRGFTSFSERNPPVLVVNRLNNLLDKVTNIILNHNGMVDKYMGDAVMAIWGAPGTDKKQATHACQAAIEIRDIIMHETEFKVGIGLNYGHAIVGNMGSSRRFDYTAIGDTVNTTSRLEKATKELGETIVISEAVAKQLGEEGASFQLKDLGQILVKGKTQSIHVFGLVD